MTSAGSRKSERDPRRAAARRRRSAAAERGRRPVGLPRRVSVSWSSSSFHGWWPPHRQERRPPVAGRRLLLAVQGLLDLAGCGLQQRRRIAAGEGLLGRLVDRRQHVDAVRDARAAADAPFRRSTSGTRRRGSTRRPRRGCRCAAAASRSRATTSWRPPWCRSSRRTSPRRPSWPGSACAVTAALMPIADAACSLRAGRDGGDSVVDLVGGGDAGHPRAADLHRGLAGAEELVGTDAVETGR